MPLLSITISLKRDVADQFGDFLIEEGALSVSVEDADEGTASELAIYGEPGATSGLWERCELTTLFQGGHGNVDGIEAMWRAADTLGITALNFTQTIVDDIDWVKQNQAQFQPIVISPRITIVPTWHEITNTAQNAVNIKLDPGTAFGTGSHPTTRLCLQWLEENVEPTETVLDYGTGSGILAIAAIKLGALEAVGVDIDSAAVDTARYNATQNNVVISFSTTDNILDYTADITVANILANPLKILAPLLASHTSIGGKLVLAGILDEQALDIMNIYRPYFDLAVWRQDEGWSAIAGMRV
ncbi:MAG: 50S ribosomal protein L11 methyltransferase [Pseudomonadota bacterium]